MKLHKIIEKSTEYDFLILNLRNLMNQQELNEADLSRKTRIPQATLHKILTGKTEDPRASTLKTLSDFFGISMDALFSSNFSKIMTNKLGNLQSIPIISWTECAQSHSLISSISPSSWKEWVASNFLGKHAYALITKPSMSPRFPKGTLLFIDPEANPADGDYVVVLYQGTNEATLREFSTDGPMQLLLPINPNAEPTRMDSSVAILGVLIKSSFTY